jgi:hypothetical protein
MFAQRIQEFLILGPSPEFTASVALDELHDERAATAHAPSSSSRGDGEAAAVALEQRGRDRLRKLSVGAQLLAADWARYLEEEQILKEHVETVLTRVDRIRSVLGAANVHAKLTLHAELTAKVQLLSLAHTLDGLQRFAHVRDIPALVFGVVDSLPAYLPEDAVVRRRMHEVVGEVKAALLTAFHAEFEGHLVDKRDANDAKAVWSGFLGTARDWLLGYALVSLLPLLVSDAQTQVLERYTEALDEALTPLWGRFHFHLASARESRSVEQLVWTFNYAKSFVSLLIDLVTQLTSAGQLQRLHAGDYKAAGLRHIVDKTVRFMRAHIAQSIVDFSPLSRAVCVQVVERALDLDDALSKLTVALPPLAVAAVLCDARAVHAMWVDADRAFFAAFMAKVCAEDTDVVFGFRTAIQLASSSAAAGPRAVTARHASPSPSPAPSSSSSSSSSSARQSRCYNGVYDCLYVFSLAVTRYQHLPPPAHDAFAAAVLEPLLAVAVALFLYRIRAHLSLYCVANGLLPYSEPLSRHPQTKHLHAPRSLLDFFDSAQYFQLSLGALLGSSALRGRRSMKRRYEGRWRHLHQWFPEGSLTAGDVDNGYTPQAAVKTAFDFTPPDAGTAAAGAPGGAGGEDSTLGAVADLVRAQVVTMSTILEKQWVKLAAAAASS